MPRSSPFIDALSVEAWDARFRWRQSGRLRDMSIDQTWQRVASALSAVEPPERSAAMHRDLVRAFGNWQLLPDERILITAGTDHAYWPSDDLVAVINAAAFVRNPWTPEAHLDEDAFASVAALAVRMLDNASMLSGESRGKACIGMRIGLIGVSDALALLGQDYASDTACETAENLARSMSLACWTQADQLVRLRGPADPMSGGDCAPEASSAALEAFGDTISRAGRRYRRLTAITSQGMLALLANNVSDAVDPLCLECAAKRARLFAPAHASPSPGYALTLMRQMLGSRGRRTTLALRCDEVPMEAKMRLRRAIQRWIDARMVYPFVVHDGISAATLETNARLAEAYELGAWEARRI